LALAAGTRVGTNEVLGLIGSGGMGEVYRAHDSKLGRDVALKVLPPSVAQDRDRVARFEREARTLAGLNHPNIAHVYGFEQSPDLSALIMELVAGEDLAARLARGALPVPEALSMARQVVDALEFAHAHGVMHRDLKPGSIKIRPDGTVKILDFGLAKALDPFSSASGQIDAATMTFPGDDAPGRDSRHGGLHVAGAGARARR
jgi:serine/threonine protein kinase